MKVGFIGLGSMGMPMSKNLLKAGFQLTVHNRSRGKVGEIMAFGADPAVSAAEVTQASDIVLTCLPDVPTVEEIYLGVGGIVSNSRPGQILVDHSTIGPSTAREISQTAKARGALFLDAPVSGFPTGATNATLTIMVGGDQWAFKEALPVFQAMGSNILHVGPTGTGSSMKLVNQLMLIINTLGAVEGVLLGIRLGIDPQALIDTANSSSGQSLALSMVAPLLIDPDFRGDIATSSAIKDIGLLNEVATEAGVPIPIAIEASNVMRTVITMGLGEAGVSALINVLHQMGD